MRLLLLALLILPALPADAQVGQNRFDPVVFLGTLKIQQDWADGSVAKPPHTIQYFRDTVGMYNAPVGFTMVTRDSAADGWSVALDYDADRFGSLKLVRISCHRSVPDSLASELLSGLIHRVEVVLAKKIMQKKDGPPDRVLWTWVPRAGYYLDASCARNAKRAALLRLDLRHTD